MRVPLTVIVKTSSACNMACTYCDADIYSRQRMSFTVLAHTIAKALEGGGPTHFVWHGGEPLLLGKEFYKKAAWLQENYRRADQTVSNALQTNGTLIDDEWIDLFDACGFSIGVSLDGPAELHDRQRVLQNKAGTHPQVMDAIARLKARNRGFGVLAVVTDETIKLGARRFFDFFMEHGLDRFALLCQKPAIINGGTRQLSRHDHSVFVREIFDLWYERDDPNVHIRDFESIMRALLGGHHTLCLLAGHCIGKYFAIDVNGDIFHCDEFMNDPQYRLGNVTVDDFSSVSAGPAMAALVRAEESNVEGLACKWRAICNGGCPKDRYVAARHANGERIECCGYADLIEHIQGRIAENPRLAERKLPPATAPHAPLSS